VVYPTFLYKLDAILASGFISSSDPDQSRWTAYEPILTQSMTWRVGSRPMMLPEGDSRLSQSPELASKAGECMDDAKRIAVAGYRQVLEDGRDVCSSESDAEYTDHGEVLEGMYTDGATLASARLTMEQPNALRAKGRAGGPVTDLGKW
jgi:hypothetical protein